MKQSHQLYHQHYILRGYCQPVTDEKFACETLARLVKDLKMETYLEPVCKYSWVEGNKGMTGVVGLTTSHASFHIFEDEEGPGLHTFQADVYSCRKFNPQVVLKRYQKDFGLILDNRLQTILIDRNHGLKVR